MATQFDQDKRALEEREREEDYTYFGAIGKNLEREEPTKDPPLAESPVAKPWPRYEDTWYAECLTLITVCILLTSQGTTSFSTIHQDIDAIPRCRYFSS